MLDTILKLVEAGLSLWASKEKTKYVDQYTDLKKRYYEESNKPRSERGDAILDNLEFQLCLLATGFAASVGKSEAPNQPGPPAA